MLQLSICALRVISLPQILADVEKVKTFSYREVTPQPLNGSTMSKAYLAMLYRLIMPYELLILSLTPEIHVLLKKNQNIGLCEAPSYILWLCHLLTISYPTVPRSIEKEPKYVKTYRCDFLCLYTTNCMIESIYCSIHDSMNMLSERCHTGNQLLQRVEED